jgi:hypothetical protein
VTGSGRVRFFALLLFLSSGAWIAAGQGRGYADTARAHRGEARGLFFSPPPAPLIPLPHFAEIRDSLPAPIFEENPLWVELYWRTWELAFHNFHQPGPGSGFVSNYIDASFNDNLFLWDTGFMTMFCNIAHPLVPGIASLDNFYAKQHVTGEICREIQRETGLDLVFWANRDDTPLISRWGWTNTIPETATAVRYIGRPVPKPNPHCTLDALNHPILAWAELESFRYTGDSMRLRMVRLPLERYYRALQTYLRQGNGLYMADWASMDDSPRNPFLEGGGCGVDISAEMVLFARGLSEIAEICGDRDAGAIFAREADELAARVNAQMWDPVRGFYLDLTLEGKLVPVKTVGAFWSLLAGIPDTARVRALLAHLRNPATFGRRHPVPTLAADEEGYDGRGRYWSGGVWSPTNTMVIRGCEAAGERELARSIAIRHLEEVAAVYRRTGTIWENYAPDTCDHGLQPGGTPVQRDFVGWSGLAPILYFFEYGLGLAPDARENTLTWDLYSPERTGCAHYRFNGRVVSLLAEPRRTGARRHLRITSSGAFLLVVKEEGRVVRVAVPAGSSALEL